MTGLGPARCATIPSNQVESYFARLRRMIDWQHHGVSPRYLYQYANEAAWKEDFRRLKQRVAVARALAGNPAMVLADEPTAALDKDSAADVVDLLKRLGAERGTTTLLVTHDNRSLRLKPWLVLAESGP